MCVFLLVATTLLSYSPIAEGYYCATTVYAAGNPCSPHNQRIRNAFTTRAPSYRYYSHQTTSSSRWMPSRSSRRNSSRDKSSSSKPSRPVWKPSSWSVPEARSFTVLPEFMKRIRLSTAETRYGTTFNEEMKSFKTKRIPKKLFGLGVGPAFISSAGYSFGAGLVCYSVYHRYHHFRHLLHESGHLDQWNGPYFSAYYHK